MKKVISIMISALAVCAISCQKDDMAPELGRKTINMHIFASHDDTKTALIEEDEKLVPYWTEGDQVAVLELIYSKFEKDSKDWTGPEDWPEMWYWSEPNTAQSKIANFSVTLESR